MDLKQVITATLRLINKETKTPYTGENIVVQLFDKDTVEDDFLGEIGLDAQGTANITFDTGKLESWDSANETLPDLYFKVMDGKKQVYKSKVIYDADVIKMGSFSFKNGSKISLGTYLI